MSETCRWKFGPDAPACTNEATTTYHLSLPAEVAPGVMIAEDQREQDIPICERHEALIKSLERPDVFSMRDSGRDGLPIPGEHKSHRSWTADCLGCSFDFDPPWAESR